MTKRFKMMKRNNVLFMMMVLLLSVATLSLVSCGGDDDDDDGPDDINPLLEAALEDLQGSWTQTSVTQDGDEPDYPITSNPTVTFNVDLENGTENTYSITNGHYAFEGSGDFSFVADTQYSLINFNDDFSASWAVSGTTLTITRNVEEEIGPGAARVATIGTYVMTFEKQ